MKNKTHDELLTEGWLEYPNKRFSFHGYEKNPIKSYYKVEGKICTCLFIFIGKSNFTIKLPTDGK